MKKKFADYPKIVEVSKTEFRKIDMKDNPYYGAMCLLEIKETEKPWDVERSYGTDTILDNGYKWLTLYPRAENFSIIAIFSDEDEFKEFYFDIAKEVKFKPKVPFIKDLYLDVVLTKENDVIFLDEEELENALEKTDIKKSDYELAKKTADRILNKFHKPEEFEELKQFATNCLYEFMK